MPNLFVMNHEAKALPHNFFPINATITSIIIIIICIYYIYIKASMDIKSTVARSQMKRFQRSQKSKMHLNTSDPNTTEPAHTEWNNRPAPRPEPTR